MHTAANRNETASAGENAPAKQAWSTPAIGKLWAAKTMSPIPPPAKTQESSIEPTAKPSWGPIGES